MRTLCPKCQMLQPENIEHETFNHCLIALAAAQGALNNLLNNLGELQNEYFRKEMEKIENRKF